MGYIRASVLSLIACYCLSVLFAGLSPDFLEVCKPALPAQSGSRPDQVRYVLDSTACMGDKSEIKDAIRSFPALESSYVVSATAYLAMYLNAKFKVIADYNPALWKLMILFCPAMLAAMVCSAGIISNAYHWYSSLAGAAIGWVCAVTAYRSSYASIQD